jgi:Sec-independent protein translocase protein TatA
MGIWEILLIVGLILVVMGPEKIPEAARLFGKAVREVRKMSNLLRDAVDIDLDEPRKPARPVTGQKTSVGTYDVVDDFDDMGDAHYYEEEEEVHEIFSVEMTPRRRTDVSEIALGAPVEPELHREVYLHIPFEETI